MKPTRSTALIALLTLGAISAAARGEDVYVLTAPATAELAAAAQQREAAQAQALAERRQRMIDECVANHGYEEDCVREVDTELRAEGARIIHVRPPQ
ncbi:MAG: hypothetical protein E6H63_18215 [Betaproteobacteria bacterium]|nr:MAG: hypothetical protein E6H63_18215 [Betaproteobacteria bacterium]TMH46609.1 MAG: hypothetical protein E6H54_02050 [Betaproteobacteria bacterium]